MPRLFAALLLVLTVAAPTTAEPGADLAPATECGGAPAILAAEARSRQPQLAQDTSCRMGCVRHRNVCLNTCADQRCRDGCERGWSRCLSRCE